MRAAVIDPGGDAEKILAGIAQLGLKVEQILLTHGHVDHAGGAAQLKEALDAAGAAEGQAPVPIIGPDVRDAFLLGEVETSARKLGLTGLRNVTPDRYLSEGETVTLGELVFEVLHVPGHTPGHIVFFERDARIAFSGDTVFKGSIGRSDFAYGDGALLIEGIRGKLLPLGDDVTFVPGHGPASTFGAERVENPFLQG
jgi:glyoxylase-like metal-dependent hydrolase (beta-lactamase superfamily II)